MSKIENHTKFLSQEYDDYDSYWEDSDGNFWKLEPFPVDYDEPQEEDEWAFWEEEEEPDDEEENEDYKE